VSQSNGQHAPIDPRKIEVVLHVGSKPYRPRFCAEATALAGATTLPEKSGLVKALIGIVIGYWILIGLPFFWYDS